MFVRSKSRWKDGKLFILVQSGGRESKERGMLRRRLNKFWGRLEKAAAPDQQP